MKDLVFKAATPEQISKRPKPNIKSFYIEVDLCDIIPLGCYTLTPSIEIERFNSDMEDDIITLLNL